jgi:hypothetical protein
MSNGQSVTIAAITGVHCPAGLVLVTLAAGTTAISRASLLKITRGKWAPDMTLHSEFNTSPEDGALSGKLLHLALPVRWSLVGQARGPIEMACTYDIHPRGARLMSGSDLSIGDLVMIERGRSKSLCQVVWRADPESPMRGQFTVRCVDSGRSPWDEELQQMEEQYQPVILDGPQNRTRGFSRLVANRLDANRRRSPRFLVDGQVELIGGIRRVAGAVSQISEFGARITAPVMNPGTDFRLMLSMLDVSVTLKARVKYLGENLGMGVEFQEIRRGDRPLLSYVLSKLRTRKAEEFTPVEVVREPLAAAG